MKLTVTGFENNQPVPAEYAFGIPDPEQHMSLGRNRNPALTWDDIPEGTRSFVIICVDPDVPGKPDDVNQEGRTIPADLERVDFYHWVMVDVAPDTRRIGEGEVCDGVTPGGKRDPEGPPGARQGLNDYTNFLAGDPDMEGQYFGYDGPCPPWNDERLHHYHFVVYATDLEECPVDGDFTGPEVMQAIEGHVLDEARVVGTYTLNPDVSG